MKGTASPSAGPPDRRLPAWLLSVIAAAFLAFAPLMFGTKGLLAILAAVLAVLRLRQRERGAALAGLCLGVGGVGTWASSNVLSACSSAGEGQAACYASAAPLYFAVSVGIVVVGAALTILALRRRAT